MIPPRAARVEDPGIRPAGRRVSRARHLRVLISTPPSNDPPLPCRLNGAERRSPAAAAFKLAAPGGLPWLHCTPVAVHASRQECTIVDYWSAPSVAPASDGSTAVAAGGFKRALHRILRQTGGGRPRQRRAAFTVSCAAPTRTEPIPGTGGERGGGGGIWCVGRCTSRAGMLHACL